MRKFAIIVLLLMAFMSLGMGPKVDVENVPQEKSKERIVWPPPPSEPKIEFLYSISKPDDLQIRKGFFSRLWEMIAGESREGLLKPFGVFAGGNGRLYVTDSGDQSVHVFDLGEKDHFIIEGVHKQRFSSPIAVAADKDGRIYVSDSVAKRVYVFGEKGDFLSEIGSDGRMERPTGIAVDNESQTLYVVDTIAGKVLVYGLDGKYKSSMGEPGNENGQFNRPTFIALGRDGSLYVTDTVFEAAQIFNRSGQLLLVFGRPGTGSGEFAIPAAVTISADDRIYIADSYNSRIQVFRYIRAGTNKAENGQR